MPSTSGRSSRSTLMLTNRSFITAATPASSNDSCAITWHQWHAEYPTLSSTGLSSARAFSNASSPHGNQSTGLSACCRRYGLVSSASRFTAPRVSAYRVELVERERLALAGLHDRNDALTPPAVGHAYDDGVEHGWVALQRRLHLFGV